MKIKQGYNNRPTEIRLNSSDRELDGRTAAVWLRQVGLEVEKTKVDYVPIKNYTAKQLSKLPEFSIVIDQNNEKFVITRSTIKVESETLAYATLTELLDLRDELNAVIQELIA